MHYWSCSHLLTCHVFLISLSLPLFYLPCARQIPFSIHCVECCKTSKCQVRDKSVHRSPLPLHSRNWLAKRQANTCWWTISVKLQYLWADLHSQLRQIFRFRDSTPSGSTPATQHGLLITYHSTFSYYKFYDERIEEGDHFPSQAIGTTLRCGRTWTWTLTVANVSERDIPLCLYLSRTKSGWSLDHPVIFASL